MILKGVTAARSDVLLQCSGTNPPRTAWLHWQEPGTSHPIFLPTPLPFAELLTGTAPATGAFLLTHECSLTHFYSKPTQPSTLLEAQTPFPGSPKLSNLEMWYPKPFCLWPGVQSDAVGSVLFLPDLGQADLHHLRLNRNISLTAQLL